MKLFDRIAGLFQRGDTFVPPRETGWLNTSQFGYLPGRYRNNVDFAPAYACVQVLAQELARLDLYHYAIDGSGRRVRQTDTAIARVLRRPHPHMSRVEWVHYLMRVMLTDGNALAIAQRDARGAVRYLHPQPPRAMWPYVVEASGELFYRRMTHMDALSVDPTPDEMVLGRDVLHVRADAPSHPLVGETPLVAAAVASQIGNSIMESSHAFFANGARPSGILRTPNKLSNEVFQRIKRSWQAAHGGTSQGGTAVLDNAFEYQQLSLNPVDAEIIKQYQLAVEDVARVFRVPLFMLGDLSNATMTNVKELVRAFYNGGLGFYVRAWETALERFFDLPVGETIEFDVEGGLLRDDMETRYKALAQGVQGGFVTPNEARRQERRGDDPDGDSLLVQKQMRPLGQVISPPEPEAEPAPEMDPERALEMFEAVRRSRL